MAALFDKIQKIPPRTRLISFIILIFVLVVVYVWQFQMPMKAEIDRLTRQVSDLQTRIQKNDAKIRKLDELKAEVGDLRVKLAVLTEQLPPESEVSGLLRQIQNLVNQSGLVLKHWKPEKRRTHPSGLYEEIPITMSLVGGYHNTAAFFDRVSKLTRIVNILNIKMGGAKRGQGGNMNINVDCTAMTFSAVEKKVEARQQGKKRR